MGATVKEANGIALSRPGPSRGPAQPERDYNQVGC
jgi:hypothetical protein